MTEIDSTFIEGEFDMEIFRNKRVLIDEELGQDCSFLIMKMVKDLNYRVFQFNDDGKKLEQAFAKNNVKTQVGSFYNENSEELSNLNCIEKEYEILDDISAAKALGFNPRSIISVFRAETAQTSDYYEYDLVIKLRNLKSGCSVKIDGEIKVVNRNNTIVDLKYKIFSNKVVFIK